jgi:hypothetical protein
MKPSLVFMMRLSGSMKFFCALGSGTSDGGAAGFPGCSRPRQEVLADEVRHAGRQQQRLVDLPEAERLAHEQAESDSPPGHQNLLFLGQAPS